MTQYILDPRSPAYLDSLGIARKDVVELEYLDYACSKYLALGLEDTMPARPGGIAGGGL